MGSAPDEPRGLVREIELNVLECKVCFERYGSSAARRPCSLPCGHAVCRQCAWALCRRPGEEAAAAAQGQLLCPFCRRGGRLSQAIDCLPLLQLAELVGRGWEGADPEARSSSSSSSQPELAAVFGGWGQLINPRGLAVCRESGTVAVAHDGGGERQRVRLLDRAGRCLPGPAAESLRYPLDVALAGGGRLLVVTDAGDSSVKVWACGRGEAEPGLTVIRGGFSLPWGVDAASAEQVALTDAGRGSLLLLTLRLPGGALLSQECVCERLCCPREVAVCPLDSCIHVLEHLQPSPGVGGGPAVRLKTFNNQRQLIRQIDSSGFSPYPHIPPGVSAIAVDGKGNVLLADVDRKAVLRVGTGDNRQRRAVVVVDRGLARPVALAWAADDTLVVLDAGDHTWKVYTTCPETASASPKPPPQQ